MNKNFRRVKPSQVKEAKQTAIAKLDASNLGQLCSRVNSTKNGSLCVFFAAKTHKEGVPFRAIVSEAGTWQAHLSGYIAKHLAQVRVRDPYKVPNSEAVTSFLEKNEARVTSAFSLDVADMYFSIPQGKVLMELRSAIEEQGATRFQNAAGISVDSFLELVQAYLLSTIVQHEDAHYVQKDGICIGSRVAPYLSEIFLAACGRAIESSLEEDSVLSIFRYVDDFLVLCSTPRGAPLQHCLNAVLNVFKDCCPDLSFTYELPENASIRFLDIFIHFGQHHACWRYEPRSSKAFLPHASAHSKTVKRAVATTALLAALKKSCPHQMAASFERQASRLQNAGYPKSLLKPTCEALLQKIKGKEKRRPSQPTEGDRRRMAVLPYVHGFSHAMKKVGQKHGVKVVFSAPNKAYGMCRQVNRCAPLRVCDKKHRTRYADCSKNVIYKIPLRCRSVYIGQTGRCVNDRAREHAASLQTTPSGHLATHVRDCQCEAYMQKIAVIGKKKSRIGREIVEALAIDEAGDSCVSVPSVALSRTEIEFLRSHPR